MIFRAVEDADLIQKTRRGDVEAYNLLISRWEKRVFNYVLRLVGSREDALDLSQDIFLKAYQNIRKLDDTSRFAPWLFRIAHNEAYSLLRKRRPEVDSEDSGVADR
ncbi:MAG: sigma-70 family RNA polymerase sigma factor, partial [Acidobacteriota bacterium]|nr:sigma-70 family RNA polymerase sigma factor [Acidobacteriota bacterium]